MGARYELKKEDSLSVDLIRALVKAGILLELDHASLPAKLTFNLGKKYEGPKHEYKRNTTSGIGFCEVCHSDDMNDGNHILTSLKIEKEDNIPCNSGVERFLGNHQAIENNIETIAKENLGVCEPRKDFEKAVKAAVKEFGHDELLEAFYNWTASIGTFMGRRPVNAFLKNVNSHIGSVRVKPQVSNPSLSKVEERIAYISDNKVFFTGDYRIKLASLIKDFGPEDVILSFEQFFQDVDDKGMQWAAREFLQRAAVMITIIRRKRAEVETQAQLQAAALAAAKEAVQEETTEEDEEEL